MNMSETLNESTTSYQVIKNHYDIKKIYLVYWYFEVDGVILTHNLPQG
jgi:hypothetical protein